MSLSLKYLDHSSKWRVELGIWKVIFRVPEEIVYSFSVYFRIVQIRPNVRCTTVWIKGFGLRLPLSKSLTLFQIRIFFTISSLISSHLELSRIESAKLTPSILMEVFIISFVLVDQFYFYMHQPIRLDFLKSLSSSSMHRPIVLKSLVTGNIS